MGAKQGEWVIMICRVCSIGVTFMRRAPAQQPDCSMCHCCIQHGCVGGHSSVIWFRDSSACPSMLWRCKDWLLSGWGPLDGGKVVASAAERRGVSNRAHVS